MQGIDKTVNVIQGYIFGMRNFYRWIKAKKYHFVAWITYIIYESILTGLFADEFGPIENYVVHYVLNISLFYSHFFSLNKIRLGRTAISYFLLLPLIILEVLFYSSLLALLNHLFTSYNQPSFSEFLGIDYRFIIGAIYRALFFIIMATGYYFVNSFFIEQRTLQQSRRQQLSEIIARKSLEKDFILMQNAYLRAQVNPHLLFNALSFIHRRIRKLDNVSGDMIIRIADMMRYAIENMTRNNIFSLGNEIEQTENLINILKSIHQKRFNLKLIVDHCVDTELEIIPLMLITLTENMYKHGDLSQPEFPGVIHISLETGALRIRTQNLIGRNFNSLSLNKGLPNLKQRLENTYQKMAGISWRLVDTIFYLEINIQNISQIR